MLERSLCVSRFGSFDGCTDSRAEVQRVGVNVNQVARLLNGGGGVGRRADEALAATEVMVARLDPLVEWLMRVAGFAE